ncbi:leucine-rich repeat-containing protein 71 isoform X3 [Patella vulgata]|uniref:leucine-rich repeat-containing protein 71 isoform X3 n=1 Tax=Patella vulgata TaxID=6465 RepID=UPI00217F865C|nr:leucine-rich repeat-containing protein 71 isoform X3 [Patella vulgata]
MPPIGSRSSSRTGGLASRLRMGKKSDKAMVKDKNQSSVSQEQQDENSSKTPEPHMCSGHFQADFIELCRRNNVTFVTPIVLRGKPQPLPSQVPEGKPEKGKDKGKAPPQPEPEPEPELTEDGEPIETPPKTYVTKEKFDYFKPTIDVEMDNPDKTDTVCEVYIRGWKIDDTMMHIFRQCWPSMDKLHTINLWHAGLTGSTVSILASFLPVCATLKNLILDGNTVKEENFGELIGEECLVQNVSLRYCSITDKGADSIGTALGSAKKSNTKLLSLNLNGNQITDVGAGHISRGLRMNRNLLCLSMSSNKIGDKGVVKLAEALSRFSLKHEEVVERRRQISEKGSPDRNKSPPLSRRAHSNDRPGSVRSNTQTEKDKSKRDKPSAKKKDAKGKDAKEDDKKGTKGKDDKAGTKKEPRGTRGTATVSGKSSGASMAADAGKNAGKTKDRKKKMTPQEQEPTEASEVINPLLEVADYMDGELWVAGNRVLINLNLSRNQVDEEGVRALLKAVQYQTTLTQLESKHSGTGLMRINLQRNPISSDSEALKKLHDLMLTKDPFYKPSPTPDAEAA